jgi:zinc protease
VGAGWDHPGMLRLMMSTKSGTTIESIHALDEEIAGLARHPIDDEEIKRAKDSILNSFVFRFDSPGKVLQEKMAYEFYGYPLDFLENFQKEIEKVTKEDVARVATKYIHREQMAVLVVGNIGEFDKPLSSLGAVNKLDISIPAPPPGLVPEQGDHP